MRKGRRHPAAGLAALLAGLVLTALPTELRAGEDPGPDEGRRETKVEGLERRMGDLERRHEEEIDTLRREIERLRDELAGGEGDDSDLERLIELAEKEAAEPPEGEEGADDTSFIAKGLGLQALNPEISVTGDFLTTWRDREGEMPEWDFLFRGLGVHIESYLDPYTRMKAAVGVDADGAHLGEAYITRFGALPGLGITAGKFRQQFGVVNRWHKHALDQIDFPVPLRKTFGNGGLNQVGFSFDWTMPEWAGASQEAILQIAGGTNDVVFGENSRQIPSFLLRYVNFRDLSKDTYFEVGASGLFGWNDEWEVTRGGVTTIDHDRRPVRVLGLDATVRWEPTERMRYSSFEWRTEAYHVAKGVTAPDGSGADRLGTYGAYTSLQSRVSRTVDLGIRFDWFKADSRHYAAGDSLAPLAFDSGDPYRWQVGPYVTWRQSPWVTVRLETDYASGRGMEPRELLIALQIVVAAGPHKHERY